MPLFGPESANHTFVDYRSKQCRSEHDGPRWEQLTSFTRLAVVAALTEWKSGNDCKPCHTSCLLPTTNYQLLTTDYDYELRATTHQEITMNHDQELTREASMPVLTRRGFMGGTALTAATLAVPGILRGQAAQPTRKIKLGVVGCGGRGAWIANLFPEHGGYEMHAIADYFPEVAEAVGQNLG